MASRAPPRRRGFILVLVIDELQARDSDRDALARVCRDFDLERPDELEREIRVAASQAINQLRLRAAARALGIISG